ncbi:DUF1249 domain-containing protein [Motilimonas eburnea]|uniref:DUF1249 domain-containing protein n=1 Tax=Motilimonas eburnea TaxID=1737488 RepID=UPI001E3CF4EF
MTKKYAPDLPRFMRLCETNYMQLLKLLPNQFFAQQGYRFSAGQNIDYQIDVLEQSRYTSLLKVQQICDIQPDFMRPVIRVRLYHDARLAEVCASQHIFHLQPKYDYPNDKMHHKDEKLQVNLFLADWLKFCIEHGYCRQQIFKTND